MKRIVSILLLLIFLFNVGGHYLLFVGLHHHADRMLSQKIEADQYNDAETVELKIPVTMPYPLPENDFVRVDGKFEYKGSFYKLIKQKLENDTMFIVCIRDITTKQVANTLKDYVSKTNDIPLSSKSSSLFGKFLKDFENIDAQLLQEGSGWSSKITFAHLTFNPHPAVITLHGPPPKA